MIKEMNLFEIKIYRCTQEAHEQEMLHKKKEYLNFLMKEGADNGSLSSEIKKNFEDDFDRDKYFSWKFNEVIGYIDIVVIGLKVVGELFFVREKVSSQLKKKTFVYKGKLFEHFVHAGDIEFNSLQLFEEIKSSLKSALITDSSVKDKRRYVDLENFENVGIRFDWHGFFFGDF